LESSVRKPADAAAYAKTVEAEADKRARIFAAEAAKSETELRAQADATKVTTEATAAAAATEATAISQANATKAQGFAQADATRAVGAAEAAAIEAKGLAEASATSAQAEALKVNQDAVIQQLLASSLPEIVSAAAGAFKGMDNVVLLNGTDGVGDVLGQVMATGGTMFGVAKELMNSINSNVSAAPGEATKPAPVMPPPVA